MGAAKLTPKALLWLNEYLIDLNASQAAIRAGVAPANARKQGYRYLKHPEVKRLLAERQAEQLAAAHLSATRVLEELRRVSLVDIRTFFNADGTLKAMKDLTPEQGACIASMEVVIGNVSGGDGKSDTIHKFKLWDKTRSLEMLAKHYALLTDVVRVEEEEKQIHRLLAGRQRAAALARGEQHEPNAGDQTHEQ